MRHQSAWPWWRWLLTGLTLLALVLSIILSWHYLKGGLMIGCGGGSPCEQVLNSRWSVIAGIFPVSGLAAGVYMALMFSGFFIGPSAEETIRQMAWRVMLFLAGAIAGSAIWFTILQKWFIGEFCPYCMTTHLTGLFLASLIIWRAWKESGELKFRKGQVIKSALPGLGLAVLMAISQFIINPAVALQKGESQIEMPEIDNNTAPVVGSPDAQYIVTLLFDYQCPHCQKLHFFLNDAIQHYGGRLAFVLCPASLNSECNPYIPKDVYAFKNSCELARISLAVWLADRGAFPVFENWMFTFESGDRWQPRSLENARTKAIELLGQGKFDAAWSNPWITSYMQTCVQIYGKTLQNGQSGIPKLIYGSQWVIPQPNTAAEFITILQNNLELPKP